MLEQRCDLLRSLHVPGTGAVQAPVNVLAVPQAPPTDRLAQLGVARVSYGSSIQRRAMEELSGFLAGLPR